MISLARRLPFALDPLIAEAKRRMWRRRLLLAAALVVVGAAAAVTVNGARAPARTNTAALEARWQTTQVCRDSRKGDGQALFSKPQAGNVIGKDVGWISDPMRVTLSFATAGGIAQQVGPSEFQPPDSHRESWATRAVRRSAGRASYATQGRGRWPERACTRRAAASAPSRFGSRFTAPSSSAAASRRPPD